MFSNKFIKVKKSAAPVDLPPPDVDLMKDPKEMTESELIQATAYFLTVVERKRMACSHHKTVDKFLHATRRHS